MAKVFRLHNGMSGEGWFPSQMMQANNLEEIISDSKDVSTSIPSPYARIDLIRHAFRRVIDQLIECEANLQELEEAFNGDTANHVLVSESFDIAQLFFFSQVLNTQLTIVPFDPVAEIQNLVIKNPQLGKPVELFWDQDSGAFNFHRVQRIYFLLYNHQLIGSTSPVTMFFASPDAREILKGKLNYGEVEFLNGENTPFYKRDSEFIRYIYSLATYPNFASLFPEVKSYLDKTLLILEWKDQDFANELRALASPAWENYEACCIGNNRNDTCEVLGVPLGILIEIDLSDSDFLIRPSKEVDTSRLPLVLPVETFVDHWIYIPPDEEWNPDWRAEEVVDTPLDQRVLPEFGYRYPFLTMGDFFEDTILKLPYVLDSERFLCIGDNYLIPVKPFFFNYFNVEDLFRFISFRDNIAGEAIEVKLEIPTANGALVYRKLYSLMNQLNIEIHLAILPFVKSNELSLHYTVGLFDSDENNDNNNEYGLTFYRDGNPHIDGRPQNRSRKTDAPFDLSSNYFTTESFDAIQLTRKENNVSGFVIPRFMEYRSGNAQFIFAVDFGTTNTHLEYKITGLQETDYQVDERKPLFCTLLKRGAMNDPLRVSNDGLFKHELVTQTIGEGQEVKFPLRTAIVENKKLKFAIKTQLHKHLNNYLLYEKEEVPGHLELQTELKWGQYNKHEDKVRVSHFIEYLLRLMYYRIILEDGKLDDTKITWFYPVSMTPFQIDFFEKQWSQQITKVFGNGSDKYLNRMPESIAPYYYYHKRLNVQGLSVSIDVGGGSSDIAIFELGEAKMISSFRFAGDTVYGDGYGGSGSTNGFIRRFANKARAYLEENDKGGLRILNDILENRESSKDFSSYLYSIGNRGGAFIYGNEIAASELKLVILVFYAALLYYVARLMKNNGISKIPQNILFSGTGSKSVELIDASRNLIHLNTLFIGIFKEVFGSEAELSSAGTRTRLVDIPKEITCKGAIYFDGKNTDVPICFWSGGHSQDQKWDKIESLAQVESTPTYAEAKTQGMPYIIVSINEFYRILDNVLEKRITSDFGVTENAYRIFKELREDNLEDHYNSGIKRKLEDFSDDTEKDQKNIQETLFFYPLVGVLNTLGEELGNLDNSGSE